MMSSHLINILLLYFKSNNGLLLIYTIFLNEQYLSFLECSIGQYGYNCAEKCSSTCADSGSCDKITGRCVGGCRAGWSGDMCDIGKALVHRDSREVNKFYS